MMDGNGGRIIRPGRPTGKPNDLISRKDAAALAEGIAVKVAEYYMGQVPGLVAKMMGEAFTAHGITLQAPPATSDSDSTGSSDLAPKV